MIAVKLNIRTPASWNLCRCVNHRLRGSASPVL